MIDKLKESPEMRTLYLVTSISAFFFVTFNFIFYMMFEPISDLFYINYFGFRFDFEFGGSQHIIHTIMNTYYYDWYLAESIHNILFVDYFYIISRSVLLFCLALFITRIFSNKSYYGDIGYKITVFPIIAGFLDIVENIATTLLLNLVMNQNFDNNYSIIIFICACIKFILILVTIMWIVIGTLMTLAIKTNDENYALDVQ